MYALLHIRDSLFSPSVSVHAFLGCLELGYRFLLFFLVDASGEEGSLEECSVNQDLIV